MKYQKEFEDQFYDEDCLNEFPEVDPKTGKYYDEEDRLLYAGFVAGIESGIKKKEPTLLELVGEWRKSDISDEELLNNIRKEIDSEEKPNGILISGETFHIKENKDYIKHRLVDLKYIHGAILHRRVSAFVNWDNENIIAWRPSAIQD